MAKQWAISMKPCDCGETMADLRLIPHPEKKRGPDGHLKQIYGYKCRNCNKVRRIPKNHPTTDTVNNPAKKSRGLPHRDEQLTQMSGIFEQQFDASRAKLSSEKEYLPEDEIQESIIQKHIDKSNIKARQEEIESLDIPVDFERHIENLTNFKYDLEGFLGAIKNKYGDDEVARKIFEQYKTVYNYLNLLVNSLRKLD